MFYSAEVLGDPDMLADISTCGMPVSLQVERLMSALEERQSDAPSVEIVDLYSLVGIERDVALDAVVAGEPSPIVLVDGRLACVGSVDVSAVLDALSISSAGQASAFS